MNTMSTMSNEELENLVELAKRIAEQGKRKISNEAALEEARRQIRERGQFIPKVDPAKPVDICF